MLRELADKRGILIGAALASGPLKNNLQYREILAKEFNLVTAENVMKWEILEPEQGKYDFSEADYLVDFARTNNQKVHGHVLVWDKQLPSWLVNGKYSREELKKILTDYINIVVGHFGNEVEQWDVVNEALKDDGGIDKDNFWYKNLGSDYIGEAFSLAHSVNPNVVLIYNEWGAEDLGKKSNEVFKLVSGLIRKGVPVSGIGLQMHIGLGFVPDIAELIENVKRYEKLGLKVYITEMDVRLQYGKGTFGEKLEKQARVYGQIIKALVDKTKIAGITFWGLDDSHSWIPYTFDKSDAPLLFDRNLQPKQAYYAVADALS